MEKTIENTITERVNELILDLCPDAGFVAKYGGTLIEAVAGESKSTVGGLFFYAEHASFEFSNGAQLADPEGHLDGKGKYRRHLKFRSAEDLETKQLENYLRQVFH